MVHCLLFRFLARGLVDPNWGQSAVLKNGQVRIKVEALEDHAHLTAQGPQAFCGIFNLLTLEDDITLFRDFQEVHAADQS